MRHTDWRAVAARDDFDNPIPGAYIARIITVTDVEEKEYLRIEWDFAEGSYKGYNGETFSRAGFWPTAMFCSYKETAKGFFKSFLNAVEASNPGYIFDDYHPELLVGKLIGVVLGEEDYTRSNGDSGKRLYVAQKKSIQQIQAGDFKLPQPKKKASAPAPQYPAADMDDDGPLPWDE